MSSDPISLRANYAEPELAPPSAARGRRGAGKRAFIPSLDAHRHLRATMTADSFRVGWRSLLLRGYDDAPEAQFTTPPTTDHLIVLVTGGACNIEGRFRGKWQSASYRAATVAMTAPGEDVCLRWRGTTRHSTLQLHLPAETIRTSLEQLSPHHPDTRVLPHGIAFDDPFIGSVILNLADAMRCGAPDLYAASAAELLSAHLIVKYGGRALPTAFPRDSARALRVRDYMYANLGTNVSLDVLAGVACLSRFHLIRMFRQVYGETPLRFLTRLRMEEACRRLALGDDAIANIAADCGYVNPTHFAAAFRRVVGVTPREYRLRCARERTTWQFGDTGEQSSGVASPDSLLVSRTTGEDTP